MTDLCDPEVWLPKEGLSQMECIQASVAMARFCVLICADPEKTEAERNEAKAIFAHTADLSCKADELEETMRIDLNLAGLEQSEAELWAAELTAQEFMERAARMEFAVTHNPKLGLIHREKASFFDDRKLVRSLVKLARTN